MENRIAILLALLAEESEQLRFRSQAEHLYTAACLGAYGAFAWGVAALQNPVFLTRPPLMRPAVVAALTIGFSAIVVIGRIFAEHWVYRTEKHNQAQLAEAISNLDGMLLLVPDRLRQRASVRGAFASAVVVGVAAIGATAFCLSLAFP
jgi:hypothetical protein